MTASEASGPGLGARTYAVDDHVLYAVAPWIGGGIVTVLGDEPNTYTVRWRDHTATHYGHQLEPDPDPACWPAGAGSALDPC